MINCPIRAHRRPGSGILQEPRGFRTPCSGKCFSICSGITSVRRTHTPDPEPNPARHRGKGAKTRDRVPSTRVVRFGEPALALGVGTHTIEGMGEPVFSPAKTVMDCFRLRQHARFDVTLKGLHIATRSGKAKPAEIVQNARNTRIGSVLRTCLETVVADGA